MYFLLYGKGFVSYNVHNLVHLVNDYKLYGSLDLVSSFGFESFLGKLKNSVQSGYKPLQQVAFYVWHQNNKILKNISNECEEGNSETFYSPLDDPGINFACFSSSSVKHFKKAKLQSGSIINTASTKDSIIIFDGNIGLVINLVTDERQLRKYIVFKKFLCVKNFFRKPLCSCDIGIFLVDKLSESAEVIDFSDRVRKGFLLPYKSKHIALELIHAVL